jgi:hypothetical protein
MRQSCLQGIIIEARTTARLSLLTFPEHRKYR